MTYGFKESPAIIAGDNVIATALDGVVYTENNRLHVKGNKQHVVYTYDGSPVGWYARNHKTSDDIYLGEGASPTIELESLDVKNVDAWAEIIAADDADAASIEE